MHLPPNRDPRSPTRMLGDASRRGVQRLPSGRVLGMPKRPGQARSPRGLRGGEADAPSG